MYRWSLLLVLAWCLTRTLAQGVLPLPQTSPTQAGFSPERLRRLEGYCGELVASGKYSGVTVLLARDGRIVEWRSFGYRDRASGRRMEKNDIFAVASLSKLVTTVAALTLVEEGRLTLREPIARYLPEFAKMKVFSGGTADAPVLVEATRPITLHDLLSQTAGFYGATYTNSALTALWKRTETSPTNLTAMSERLARFPLQAQPGEMWIYGPATDLLGALIERVSGQALGTFFATRIFRPLKMVDTGFEVSEAKRGRQVSMDDRQEDGTLKSQPPKVGPGAWPSGGGGLFSTPGDYLRFAQMLLNGGELDGVRILGPKTVELMRRDQLHGLAKPTRIYPASDGFGYGVEVRTDVSRSHWLGTEGTFGWNGATTAYCSLDPQEGLIAMIWAQHRPNGEFELYERFNNLVYQALVKPKSTP